MIKQEKTEIGEGETAKTASTLTKHYVGPYFITARNSGNAIQAPATEGSTTTVLCLTLTRDCQTDRLIAPLWTRAGGSVIFLQDIPEDRSHTSITPPPLKCRSLSPLTLQLCLFSQPMPRYIPTPSVWVSVYGRERERTVVFAQYSLSVGIFEPALPELFVINSL